MAGYNGDGGLVQCEGYSVLSQAGSSHRLLWAERPVQLPQPLSGRWRSVP
jgi:hypothetical protein